MDEKLDFSINYYRWPINKKRKLMFFFFSRLNQYENTQYFQIFLF